MPPELITLLSNAGPLGIALAVYLWHVLPKQEKDNEATRTCIKDGHKETAAALDRVATALTDQGTRIARIEGAIDHRPPSIPPSPRIADGSRDLAEPLAVVRGGAGGGG